MVGCPRRVLSVATSVSLLGASACVGTIAPGGDSDAESGASAPRDERAPLDVGASDRVCDTSAQGADGSLRRLSRAQYLNTIHALLPQAIAGELEAELALFPTDATQVSPGELSEEHTPAHVDAVFRIAAEAAALLARDPEALASLGFGCALHPEVDDGCVTRLVSELGARMYGRPLSATEVEAYLATWETTGAETTGVETTQERIEAVLGAMLMSPELLFHVTDRIDGRIEPYSLASRLSYRLTGGPADGPLVAAAEDGSILEAAVRETHARRLMDTPQARRHVRQLFIRWLDLDRSVEPTSRVLAAAGIDAEGLFDELRDEALGFVEHVVFEQDGSYRDLLTSPVVVPTTERVGAIVGAPRVTAVADAPAASDGRVGLMARPALLVSPNPRSSPILRGNFMIRRFLCRSLGEPPDDADALAEDNVAGLDPERLTSREVAAAQTSPPTCNACHRQINPTGFTLTGFGPLGETRTAEAILEADGEVIRELPIDDAVDDLIVDGAPLPVRGAAGLAEAVAASREGLECAALQVFRVMHLREPRESDACLVERIHEQIDSGASLREVMVDAAVFEPTVLSPLEAGAGT